MRHKAQLNLNFASPLIRKKMGEIQSGEKTILYIILHYPTFFPFITTNFLLPSEIAQFPVSPGNFLLNLLHTSATVWFSFTIVFNVRSGDWTEIWKARVFSVLSLTGLSVETERRLQFVWISYLPHGRSLWCFFIICVLFIHNFF